MYIFFENSESISLIECGGQIISQLVELLKTTLNKLQYIIKLSERIEHIQMGRDIDRHFQQCNIISNLFDSRSLSYMWASITIHRNDKKSLNILKMVVMSMRTYYICIVRLIFGKVRSRFVNCWICSIIYHNLQSRIFIWKAEGEVTNGFQIIKLLRSNAKP